MLRQLITSLCLLVTLPAQACETALVLSIDVSNSIDPAEYALQIDGMVAALRDPEIVDEMVAGKVAIAIMQWSGPDKQALSVPWVRITSTADAAGLAVRAAGIERAFTLSNTAPAEAIYFALGLFGETPDCKRRVIDISGDGTPNSGADVRTASRAAEVAGVTINGIAIESMGLAITNFFTRVLMTTDGFVITSRGHREYATAIRNKILRELARVVG